MDIGGRRQHRVINLRHGAPRCTQYVDGAIDYRYDTQLILLHRA